MQIFDYQFHQIKPNERWKRQVKLANKISPKEWSSCKFSSIQPQWTMKTSRQSDKKDLTTWAQIAQEELSPDDRVLSSTHSSYDER